MELTFKRRDHYGVTVWESNETVKPYKTLDIELPRFRIAKGQTKSHGELYIVRELEPEKSSHYDYSRNTVSEKKLKDTIYWLNINLHRI